MTFRQLSTLIISLTLTGCAHHAPKSFIQQMQAIEHKSHSTVGVSAVHIESGKTIEYKAGERFKMASTMKVPIGIYVLHQAQNHKISLDAMVRIEPYDLVPGSGLMGYYLTRPGLAMSVYNMLEPMMTISDNSATDILLAKAGGSKAVQKFLVSHGLRDMRVDRALMQQFIDCKGLAGNIPPKREWSLQRWKVIFDELNNNHKEHQAEAYRKHFGDDLDTTTPKAMTELLLKLYKGELLDKKHTALMLEIMGRAEGDGRIKKGLPQDALLAHKSGSWNQEQIDAFYNYTHDIGIITMPRAQGHVVISVYTGSHRGSTQKVQAEAIAEVTKIVYSLLSQ